VYLPDHKGSIGVFDSGIGGLSVANAISGLLPRERMLYLADNAHAPYGDLSDDRVRERSRYCTDVLLRAGARLIVVACNTATSIAIDGLRESNPDIPFVGLEPAVKPAATGKRVGVMATAVTLRSRRYRKLRDRYLAERAPWESSCPGLVPLIERYGPGTPQVADYLRQLFADAGPLDTVVLGCTHYPLISEDIATVLGPEVWIIDPSAAAARQVARLLEDRPRVDGVEDSVRYDFLCTCVPAPLQRTLLHLPRLNQHRRWLVPYLGGKR
jgi:glutamate racemase